METAYPTVAPVTIAANTFSGIAAITRFEPVLRTLRPALATAGVPVVGTAAAIGLVLYFVCALYTHIRVSDYRFQFGLASGFLTLAVATLTLDLATR